MKKKTILFADMDGTLLFSENGKAYFKDADLDAIKEFQQKGNLFAVNSGRALPWLVTPLKGYLSPDFLIAGTGSIIMNRQQQILQEEPIPFTAVKNILSECPMNIESAFHTKDNLYSLNQRKLYNLPLTPINSIDALEQENIYGMSFHFESNEAAKTFVDWLEASGHQEVKAFVNIVDVDVVKRNCSKGAAINILCQKLGLKPEQVYAIGDAENDINMLKAAEHGYTFYHSPETVKQCAKGCVESVAELISKILND